MFLLFDRICGAFWAWHTTENVTAVNGEYNQIFCGTFLQQTIPTLHFYSVIMSKPLLCHSGRQTTSLLSFSPFIHLLSSLASSAHTEKMSCSCCWAIHISLYSVFMPVSLLYKFFTVTVQTVQISPSPLKKCADLLVSYLFKIKKLECKQTKCTVKGLCGEFMV